MTDPAANGTPPLEERRKALKQRLVLILHAHKCLQRDKRVLKRGGEVFQCNFPECHSMKDVLNHMLSCPLGKSCTFKRCASSRRIIYHWKHCTDLECPYCIPVKNGEAGGPQVASPEEALLMSAFAELGLKIE